MKGGPNLEATEIIRTPKTTSNYLQAVEEPDAACFERFLKRAFLPRRFFCPAST
jgi:hypothetical protein